MVYRDVDLPPERVAALDALELLSRKWDATILAVLDHNGPLGFNDILDAIPDISGKVLSDVLDDLKESDLIERTVVNAAPLRVEYDLAPAGEDLEPVFDALGTWREWNLESATPTVLVADGDRRLTELFGRWLSGRYVIARAHTGVEAEDQLEEVDVLVVAESLPGTDPDTLSAAAPDDCRVVLAVEERPDPDLVAVDCDGVVRKPVVSERLVEVVDEQLSGKGSSPERRERDALAAKKSVLESVYAAQTLVGDDAYEELCSRLEMLADRVEE